MMVPRCSYGQGSIGAASGTILGVLGTPKMKENERFTDLRILGGLRRIGGGMDTHPGIKLPPAGKNAFYMTLRIPPCRGAFGASHNAHPSPTAHTQREKHASKHANFFSDLQL